MLINLRNALMAGKRLPYDAEVEYLQSTGTQWIDLGWTPSYRDTVNIDFSVLNIIKGEYAIVFGGNCAEPSSGDWFQCGCRPGGYTFFSQGGRWSYTKVGDVFKATGFADIPIVASKKCFLFAQAANNTPACYKRSCRIRAFSVNHYGENDPYMSIIPVRKGTVGYLYDRVSGELFGNAGTGAFGYGNDLKYPIPAA